MTANGSCLLRLAFPAIVLTLAALAPLPARADFFDDARKTFTKDIPHFFQDDVPCTFGGQPTSGTKASCDNKSNDSKPPPSKPQNLTPPPETLPPSTGTAVPPPPSTGQ